MRGGAARSLPGRRAVLHAGAAAGARPARLGRLRAGRARAGGAVAALEPGARGRAARLAAGRRGRARRPRRGGRCAPAVPGRRPGARSTRLPADPPPPSGARRDLRDRLAFTIDPGTAKDHDDALTVETEGDGWRVLVHIADVAASVRPGSPLDREARRRAFSVYLPGRVEPMLPHALSSGLCSLVPDRPRDTVTVELAFAADGSVVGRPRFSRAQIVSARRLAYEEVERALAGLEPLPDELLEALRSLDRLATVLRERRQARGALMLNQDELELDIGEGRVRGARRIGEPRAHALVEELMIASNEAVAAPLPAGQGARAVPGARAAGGRRGRDALREARGAGRADAAAAGAPAAARGRAGPPCGPRRRLQRHARARGARRRGLDDARAAGAAAGPLRPLLAPATWASRRAAYCHFTSPDPPLPRPRRAPRAAGARSATRPHRSRASPPAGARARTARRPSARRSGWSGAATPSRSPATSRSSSATTAARSFPGEVTGLVGGGRLRALRRAVRGLPARRGRSALDYYDLGPARRSSLIGRTSGHAIRLGDPIDVRVERIEAPRGGSRWSRPTASRPTVSAAARRGSGA